MQYLFKQAVSFFGTTYKYNSQYELPAEVESHPYFLKLVKAGLVLEAEEKQLPIPPVNEADRARKLHEKLKKKAEAEAVASPEKSEAATEEAPAQEGVQALEDQEKPSTKKKKHGK